MYWVLFLVPGILGMSEQGHGPRRARVTGVWVLTAIAIALFVGMRWKTGGDWGNYYADLVRIAYEGLSFETHRDVGYGFIAWLATRLMDPGMILITMFSGILMGFGLARFCTDQPRPWLALSISVTYIILVLGMGYMRQGIAVSILLFAFVELRKGHVWRYTFLAIVAATFHSTAVLMVPLGALVSTRNRLLIGALGLLFFAFAFQQLLSARTDVFVTNYVEAGEDSAGALVRILMTALPGAIYLFYRDRFATTIIERKFWTLISIAALLLVPALLLSPSSTVIDRLGLYLLPLQVFVGSRIPDALGNSPQLRRLLTLAVMGLYGAAYFTWLFFASHAYLWLPYRFWLFEDGICVECQEVFYE